MAERGVKRTVNTGRFEWDEKKNRKLQEERGISFQDVVDDLLTPFEAEIEKRLEAGEFKTVENFEEWKRRLIEMAKETKRVLKERKLVLEFESPEEKERALKVLREYLGNSFKVVANT